MFAFRLEHCKHLPWVFFSHRGEQRKQQLRHVPWRCRVSKPSLSSESKPTRVSGGAGTGSSPRSPSNPNHSVAPQGAAPAHQGTAHLGFGAWFDYGFHGGQTDRQTLTLVTAVTKQTKEVTSEIKLKWFLNLLLKKIADLRRLPLIWLAAHETGVLSSEISEFISKTQLMSKPSTFINTSRKALLFLAHTH